MKKIVITGPSGAGKTNLIDQLKDKGYTTVNETARRVFDSTFTDDPYLIQRDILFNQMATEMKIANQYHDLVIFDRGIPDALGFANYQDINFPFTIGYYYDIVFYLPPNKEADFSNRVEEDGKEAQYVFKKYILPYYEQQYPEKPIIKKLRKPYLENFLNNL